MARHRPRRVRIETFGSEGNPVERPWAVRRVRVVNPSLQRLHELTLVGLQLLPGLMQTDPSASQFYALLDQVKSSDLASHRLALTALQQQLASWTATYPEVSGNAQLQAYRRDLHLVLDHAEE